MATVFPFFGLIREISKKSPNSWIGRFYNLGVTVQVVSCFLIVVYFYISLPFPSRPSDNCFFIFYSSLIGSENTLLRYSFMPISQSQHFFTIKFNLITYLSKYLNVSEEFLEKRWDSLPASPNNISLLDNSIIEFFCNL